MLYVNQIGEADFPPPYAFPGVTILSFRLGVDLIHLNNIVDQYLNIGSLDAREFEYKPILPFVDLEILSYPKMENALIPGMGYTSQHECYIRIFVMKFVEILGWLIPTYEVACFCPFIVVDNPWSAFSGRDVLGFPKLLAQFGNFSPQHPFTTVSTLEFSTLSPTSKASVLPVVTIAPGATEAAVTTPRKNWPWGHLDPHAAGAALQSHVGGLDLSVLPITLVQMKEFRDGQIPPNAPYPLNACYQAIVQGRLTVDKVLNLGELPAATVTLHDYPSLQLAQALGLQSGQPLVPLSKYYMECDLHYDNVKTVFQNSDAV
jgi:hypothetical protein